MSELSKLSGLPREDVIPGKTLCRPTLEDYGIAEQEFGQAYLNMAAAATVGLPELASTVLIDRAAAKVAEGAFSYGNAGFVSTAFSKRFSGLLLWLCLRQKEPTITKADAWKLLADPETSPKVMLAVLDLWFPPRTSTGGGPNDQAGLPTGPQSTESSETKV